MGWCKLMMVTYDAFVAMDFWQKHKSECQKAILEVPTERFGIRRKNMKCG